MDHPLNDASSSLEAPEPSGSRPTSLEAQKHELDQYLTRVRTRMIGRLREVSRRVATTKQAMNLAHVIRAHPLAAVGAGVALGALLGMRRGRSPTAGGSLLGALASSLAVPLVRSLIEDWRGHLLLGQPEK